MFESWFLLSSQNIGRSANAIAFEERTQFRTMTKVSKFCILTTGWSPFEWYIKAEKNKSENQFLFSSRNVEKRPMLQPTKKGPNLERCQRSRKFVSNYWVAKFWVIFKVFAHKSWKKYARESVLIFVPKLWKKGECYSLRRNDRI